MKLRHAEAAAHDENLMGSASAAFDSPVINKRQLSHHTHTVHHNKPVHSLTADIEDACMKDIALLCFDDLDYALVMQRANADPHELQEALEDVHRCLVRNSEVLSARCFGALAQDFDVQVNRLAHQIPSHQANEKDKHMRHPEMEREHRGRHGHDDDGDDSSEDLGILHQKHQFHHNGPWHDNYHPRTIDFGRINMGDGQASGSSVHPLTWFVVLPFVAVSLYVSMKYGTIYYKRWQRQRQYYEEQVDEELMPLKGESAV